MQPEIERPDPRTQPSAGDYHPTPDMVEALTEPAQRTLDLQLDSFQRSESDCLQLLAGGSIVVGLAGLSDLSGVSDSVAGLLIAAVAAYLGLASVAACQLIDRRRAIPQGAQELDRSDGTSPTEARAEWVSALARVYDRNRPRVERKARYVYVAVILLAVETLLIGIAIAVVAFEPGAPSMGTTTTVTSPSVPPAPPPGGP